MKLTKIRDDSAWVNEFFEANSRDSAPAPARHAAQVLYAPVSCDPEVTRRCASLLSDAELRRADRFVTESLKTRFKQRRAFRRFCGATALGSPSPLSQIAFEETEKGRPYLPDAPDFWFSFSACRFGFLGAWSSTHGIGVDLEDRTQNLEATELARQFFSATEANAVEGAGDLKKVRTFFQFWSLKEAALKSIGEGLPFGLDAFEFELDPTPRVANTPPGYGGPERFSAHMIEGAESCTAIVVRSPT